MPTPAPVTTASASAAAPVGGDEPAAVSDEPVDAEPAAVSDEPVDTEEAMLAFTQCMRDQGVDMADPEVGTDGVLHLGRPQGIEDDIDRETIQEARAACSYLIEDVTFGFRDVDRTSLEDLLVEYAACMRDNGFDMADPDFSDHAPGEGDGSGQGGGPLRNVDRDDPAFVAADEVCRELFTAADIPLPGSGRGRG